MVRVNEGSGKTKNDPIVIVEAIDDREGWIYLDKFIEYYVQYNRYDDYKCDDVVDTFELELRQFRFFKDGVQVDELFVDWTHLFHVWDK